MGFRLHTTTQKTTRWSPDRPRPLGVAPASPSPGASRACGALGPASEPISCTNDKHAARWNGSSPEATPHRVRNRQDVHIFGTKMTTAACDPPSAQRNPPHLCSLKMQIHHPSPQTDSRSIKIEGVHGRVGGAKLQASVASLDPWGPSVHSLIGPLDQSSTSGQTAAHPQPDTAFVSRNSCNPNRPPSRPLPDCL
jgi:hypothetical protein